MKFCILLSITVRLRFHKIDRYAGWESCEYVGVSMDLDASLSEHFAEMGSDHVAHIRALSFPIPSMDAMEEVAKEWRNSVQEAGGVAVSKFDKDTVSAAMDALAYDDDDFDEDFIAMRNEALAMTQSSGSGSGDSNGQVISPFEKSKQEQSAGSSDDDELPFTKENVDKVLDEVRPYLISDGGNVSVDRVDEENKDVYLVLEGACGSCASSTVTMQMGIERVLKENFSDLNQVLQVEDEENAAPKELSYEIVESEVNRIKPAIIAMGGGVDILNVDSTSGSVEIKFRGANKVRQGLELALMDIEFVNEVKFAEWE